MSVKNIRLLYFGYGLRSLYFITSNNHRLESAFDVTRVVVFGKLVRNSYYKNVWGW